MCYEVHLSTTSDEDLAAYSTDLVFFEKPRPDDAVLSQLHFEHKWRLAYPPGCCSCHLRHATSPVNGFMAPQSWLTEDPEDLHATLSFIALVRRLLDAGHQADCISQWVGSSPFPGGTLTVDLTKISDEQFWFFENHHFLFTRGPADESA